VERAEDIVGALRSGQMPCDGAWPDAQVETLQQWIDAGKPAEVRRPCLGQCDVSAAAWLSRPGRITRI
jgi:hypothetical protein